MSIKIPIEVAYAMPDRQLILAIEIEPGTTPLEAIKISTIDQHFDDIHADDCHFGIFGKAITNEYQLEQGDRIEIYRPLIADPKEVRRQRAEMGLKMGKGGGK
ncbi:MAG: putative ubiquitin-RnfH superfamily antitoxin RatB of RatAB toxin-antitoxin module [Gammaproteobacteria bacterium]|jgi:putative ubiquitin-RnfH superfamily antitoxin RatB of RatAB toxin-antitoxin module